MSDIKNNTLKKEDYKHLEIEDKWQKIWEEKKIYQPNLDLPAERHDTAKNPSAGHSTLKTDSSDSDSKSSGSKGPFYNLMMFPYPSAEGLHVGSFFTYGGIDAYGRFKRMQGYEVFEPIGLDGFGIHSENYAIKVGRTPQEHAVISEENFYRQLRTLGNGFDWSRKLETYDPAYYRWTQWLFIELFKAGLAYKDKATVNFCPSCKTVLSDEQVIQKVISPKSQVISGNNKENAVGVCERCETPVERKDLEQWFFRITDYAERLLANTEKLDWTEKVKLAQTNWIGKKTGIQIEFELVNGEGLMANGESKLKVFTTRPDTLFGATFLVVAPEHEIVTEILRQVQDDKKQEIENYINKASRKEAQDRIAEGKEKTGIFSGIYAINPVSNEHIPVWIADYVLTDYGTGAIMAVPAHDKRDFEFAKKYNLPIKQVIAPVTGIKRDNETVVYGGCAVIFDPSTQKYAVSKHPDGLVRLFAGGVNKSEDLEKGIIREVEEESGLVDFSYKEKIQTVFTHFYNKRKKLSRAGWATCYLIILNSDKTGTKKLEPHELELSLEWMDAESIFKNWENNNSEKDVEHWMMFLKQAVGRAIELGYDKTSNSKYFDTSAYIGEGIIINSGEWDDWQTPDSIDKVNLWLEENGFGKKSVNYHLRDWLISRQRYWGPPIPMIYCQSCADKDESWFMTDEAKKYRDRTQNQDSRSKNEAIDIPDSKFLHHDSSVAGWYPVSQNQLPVLLPIVDDFKPLGTGKAPLANFPEFYETKCPGCGGDAVRETDVSDTFLDSSWYFFRYLATDRDDLPMPMKSERVIFRNKDIKKLSDSEEDANNLISQYPNISERLHWLPVTSYIGGAEHAVLHLLYSRFITMVFKDLGYINFEEPYQKFRANGLIIKDGAKMSKSKGNVINPDEYVKKYGADTLRTYLGFIGPFTQGGDFQDTGIEGINRFLKRVWRMAIDSRSKIQDSRIENKARTAMMHKTIKGVTEDMEELRFNTAIAKIMTYYNFLSDQNELSRSEIEVLLKLLAPFAPHMTEELWNRIHADKEQMNADPRKSVSHQWKSIHISSWPQYDVDKIISDTIIIAVQVNGKLRETFEIQDSRIKNQEEVEKMAKESENVKRHLEGKTIRKVIYIPGKILNFVVS